MHLKNHSLKFSLSFFNLSLNYMTLIRRRISGTTASNFHQKLTTSLFLQRSCSELDVYSKIAKLFSQIVHHIFLSNTMKKDCQSAMWSSSVMFVKGYIGKGLSCVIYVTLDLS